MARSSCGDLGNIPSDDRQARNGVCHTWVSRFLVSDNGSICTSSEFAAFVGKNGIKHLTSAPYHPASNGLAERAVQTVKGALRKEASGTSLERQLTQFLFRYRLTPHSTTGIAPAELLMGRRPRCRLDISHRVRDRQQKQKAGHDLHCYQRTLAAGQPVWLRNQGPGLPWLTGTITRVLNQQPRIDGRPHHTYQIPSYLRRVTLPSHQGIITRYRHTVGPPVTITNQTDICEHTCVCQPKEGGDVVS